MTLQDGLNNLLKLLDFGLFPGHFAGDVLRSKAFIQTLLTNNPEPEVKPETESTPTNEPTV